MPIRFRHFAMALFLLSAFTLSSCKVGRFVIYNFADIRDYKKFPSRPLHRPADYHFSFPEAAAGKFPKSIGFEGRTYPFEDFLSGHKTVAFLIIHNDSIQYEHYFDGYDAASVVPSFSMAKSVTSILIGCAISDGLIGSVQDPVSKYIPELAANGFDKVIVEELLQMTSGLKFNEGYTNPFGDVATFYYGRNLRRSISKMKLEAAPGQSFEYKSGNTQLLGLVLERALKTKTVTEYLQEKLWTPLGMEYDASWSLDRKNNGLEKTFCCINAVARDFAKIGRLYLHNGNWNGQQLVPENWVQQSIHADTTNGGAAFYRYQWWLPSPHGDYMAHGILGQYIYVNPAKNLVIVRLGKQEGKVDWGSIFVSMAAGY